MRNDAVLPAAAAAVPSLPQEIIDIITDFCHSEAGALSVLALVSWPRLRSARRHLFGRVELCECFRSPWEPTASVDPFRRVDFGLEIITRSPAIASCIRFLIIRPPYKGDQHHIITQGFQFLSLLPNLCSLSLNGIDCPSLKPEYLSTILSGITIVSPTFEELSLFVVQFVHTADIARLIRTFPSLKRISFSSCSISSPATMSVSLAELPMQSLICLEHFKIFQSPPQAILETLLQRDTFKLDLKGVNISLNIAFERLETFDIYDKFFRVVGNNLQTIELEVRFLDYRKPDAVVQLLSQCRQLTSISIDVCFEHLFPSLAWFVPVLEAAAASSLEEVTIHCSLISDPGQLEWGQVDDMLSRLPVFRMLSVIIHFIDMQAVLSVDPRVRDTVSSVLRMSMPRLLQAGTLRILEEE